VVLTTKNLKKGVEIFKFMLSLGMWLARGWGCGLTCCELVEAAIGICNPYLGVSIEK
jgi:hypothetical protein